MIFSLACSLAPSFNFLLAMRLMQGFCGAAMGVLAVSIIRDLYVGDRMARYTSLIFIIFMIFPVIAPTLGQLILKFSHWQSIFYFNCLAGALCWLWVYIRLPETLKPENIIPINPKRLVSVWRSVVFHREALGYVMAAAISIGALYGFLNSAQQIFAEIFNAEDVFPLAFAAIASVMAVTNYANSRIVERFGARRVSQSALIFYIFMGLMQLLAAIWAHDNMALFMILLALNMGMIGLMGGNFSSIAMEPFGKMAGAASSSNLYPHSDRRGYRHDYRAIF